MDQPFYGSQEKWHIYLIGGIVTILVLISAIIGLVEGISENLPQHVILAVMILALYFALFMLYRWWGEGDLDPKFKWLMVWMVLTLILGCIILNVYAFTVQANDACDDSEPAPLTCTSGYYSTTYQTCVLTTGNCTGTYNLLLTPGSTTASCTNSTCTRSFLGDAVDGNPSLSSSNKEFLRLLPEKDQNENIQSDDEQKILIEKLFEGWQVHAYPLYSSSNSLSFSNLEPKTSPSAMKEFLMFQSMYDFIRAQQRVQSFSSSAPLSSSTPFQVDSLSQEK